MIKDLGGFIDNSGLITSGQHANMDGGDSMARTFMILYCDPTALDPRKAADSLLLSSGYYCRNPDPTKWYSNPETLSRDQITSFIAYFAKTGDLKDHRNRLFFRHLRHALLFTWNIRTNDTRPNTPEYAWKMPDITLFDTTALWIRAFRCWPLYPLLWAFDCYTLLGVVLRVILHLLGLVWPSLLPSIDNVNIIETAHVSKTVMPTVPAILAWYVLIATPIRSEMEQFYAERNDQAPVDDYVNKFLLS